MKRLLLLILSHALAVALGFAAGIYALPILTAPPSPAEDDVVAASSAARFTGQFRRDLADSDALHWGEGTVAVSGEAIAFNGRLAPGPDYRLYLSPNFVETEVDFLRLKARMVQVGEVRTFERFLVAMPDGVDPTAFNTVIVWCESFGQFITSARYR